MSFPRRHVLRTALITSSLCVGSLFLLLGCSQQNSPKTASANSDSAALSTPDSTTEAAIDEGPKQRTAFRMHGDEMSARSGETESDDGAGHDPADQRPKLDQSDDRQTEPNSPDPGQETANQASTQDVASQSDQQSKGASRSSSESSERRDVTIQEVEAKLQAAEDALDGYIAQKDKSDYQQATKDKLQGLDKEIAKLNDELDILRQRESEKEKQLTRIKKKREAFLTELNSLDPASADDWADKRQRIDAAWQALQEAYQDGVTEE